MAAQHHRSGALVSTLLGALTFFLPCGFTQAAQFAALGTQSPLLAAQTMGFFALGTAPMLITFSVSSLRITHSPKRMFFFQIIGIITILLALFSLRNAITLFITL
jgi:sulfite exporter TauE/SafE